MKIVLSIVFWTSIGPAVFFLLVDLLVVPARWAADSIWAAEPPTSASVLIGIYALGAMVVAGRTVWVVWKRSTLISDVRTRTWFDELPTPFRLALAVGLLLAGAALVLIAVGNQLPLARWRQDAILFGGLVQGMGILGTVLALRRGTAT